MRRNIFPAIIIMALFIALGSLIGVSSEAKEPTTASIQAAAESANETAAPVVKTVRLTPLNSTGNFRHPGVAEDSRGNRLVILRSTNGKEYDYVYCPKGGTWSAPKSIANGNQPPLIKSLYATVEVDSTDRFHCQWESTKSGAVYASFKDGVWTTPILIKTKTLNRYDLISSMTVDSKDEVITADCEVLGRSKDIFLHRKAKNASSFGTPFNISRDKIPGSTQPDIAVDSRDHIFVAWKSDKILPDVEENLVVYLSEFDTNNSDVNDWLLMSPGLGWSFVPQVAVNSEDKVMTICSSSKVDQYLTRYYDPATQKLGELIPLNIGLARKPWHSFFTRMVAHGKDFYVAALTPERIIMLMKYDEENADWDKIAEINSDAAEMFDMYSGYDQIHVAWNSNKEPTGVFLTSVSVEPFSKTKIKSVVDLTVVKSVERTFFHAYYLNNLSWTANPDNTAKNLTITAQRIYRKARTEDDSKWIRIAQVAGTVYKYEDRDIPADSDYVYSITCVDDKEHESKVF